ncbi:MAG: citrate lyase acyl carrier protein [Synergistaceae bacterium]|nr:citrate lyase acyl carrier protein [Synergistaceae bacterium]
MIMNTAQAGTLESMDCLVTVTEGTAGSGVKIRITGSSATRFKTAMEKKVTEVLVSMDIKDIDVSIQDNGALDIVLGARVEAAIKRLGGAK